MNLKKDWALLTWFFLIFSFLGWIYELGWEFSLGHGFVNRGFFNGCYLPIYGFGGLILILCLQNYMENKIYIGRLNITPLLMFVAIVFITTFLEYVSSCFLEDVFGRRWWDYGSTPYNLNGRIALKNSLLFGCAGMIGLYILVPLLKKVFSHMRPKTLKVSAIVIISVVAVDFLLVISGHKFL